MKIIETRNLFEKYIYKNILRRIFFRFDPELIHDCLTNFGQFLGKYKLTRFFVSLLFKYSNPKLSQNILGIQFNNPVGLAAGFDKDALLTDIIPSIGFGFEEVGSITAKPCAGNPKPRLWRLIKSNALVVYYGLKNEGCEKIFKHLIKKIFSIPIGISIAKTNSSETVDLKNGVADYVFAYKTMAEIGAFHVINISCPNAYGGEPFTDPKSFSVLMAEIEKVRVAAPLLIKISPDLSHEQIDAILEIALKTNVNGIICSNLTKDRKINKIYDYDVPKQGGISGKVVEERANEQIKYIYKKTNGQMTIIGCGGIFNADDAYKKIRLGASLVQLLTGMIFEGPQIVSEINAGLVKLMNRDGFNHISEVIGIDNR